MATAVIESRASRFSDQAYLISPAFKQKYSYNKGLVSSDDWMSPMGEPTSAFGPVSDSPV
jgi:hypothetical protein